VSSGALTRASRRGALVVGLSLALWAAGAGAAPAATTLGQLFVPTSGCSNVARLQASAPSGTSYEVPHDGVITSWRFRNGAQPVQGLKFKVGRPGGGTLYTIVGESAGGAQAANAVTTRPARIPVKRRDYIGIYAASGHCALPTSSQFDIYAQHAGDPAVGTSSEEWPYHSHAKIPVQATLERDADRDGFGDESQDGCPDAAGNEGGCPPGPAPGLPGPVPTPPGSEGAPDETAPVFHAARLTRKKVVLRRRRTVFRYRLSEAARVTFAIQRRRGRRRVVVARFAEDATAGPNARPFSAKIGKRFLKPGRYRALLKARDDAGNVSATVVLAFRVVRPRGRGTRPPTASATCRSIKRGQLAGSRTTVLVISVSRRTFRPCKDSSVRADRFRCSRIGARPSA
jgi:hypothetical protein